MKHHLHFVVLAFAAMTTFAAANTHLTQPDLLGRWKIQVSDIVKESSSRLGIPEPVAEFTFMPDRAFTYMARQGTQEISKKGKYTVDGDKIKLDSPDWPAVLSMKGDQLAYNGFAFARQIEYNLVGEWVLAKNGIVDSAIKANFRKDGTFEFRCSNAISKGQYRLEGRQLFLAWTEVDGDKVTPGQMKKTLVVDEDGGGFSVDQWHYVRKG